MKYNHYENRPGLEVIFSNGESDLSLFYVIYEWNAAQTFYRMIEQSIQSKLSIYSDTSFNIDYEDELQLIEEINKYIDLINDKYKSNMHYINSSSDLNRLHSDSAVNADCELWRVINDRIHAYEQYLAQKDHDPRVNAYFRFETDENIPLNEKDLMFFTADRNYGDLCLNYTYKGKHWLELQSDNDLGALTDGQLQPETRISPTGYMLFRPPSPSPFYKLNKFIEWFSENFPERKINYEMALGYLLVGKLVMPAGWNDFYVPERTEWTKKLCRYKTITDVRTIKITDAKELLKRSQMI